MRSMFNVAPFSRFDLGRHAFRDGMGIPRLSLGQAQAPSIYALEDYASKIEGLTDSKTKEELRAQYAECREKDGTAQIACYAILGAKVYDAIKNESAGGTAPLPIAPPKPPSEFPIIPVMVAVLGAGALIVFLATQGKKKA